MADSEQQGKEERAESVSRQMEGSKDSTGTATPADEQPVSEDELTSETPESPKGVGDSPNRSGEDVADHEDQEPGRHETGTKGRTDRPVGTSDDRDKTGIDPG
ncbi:MAG: hypothetical protein WKF43_13315 [Acidimicrobiales bacterium]